MARSSLSLSRCRWKASLSRCNVSIVKAEVLFEFLWNGVVPEFGPVAGSEGDSKEDPDELQVH